MTLNPQQFHATLNPSWAWGAGDGHYSAEIAIRNPENPSSISGRLSWSSKEGNSQFLADNDIGGIYPVEGIHKTPSAAVTAFNRQHLPNSRIVRKFKNSEVQPLAEQIQAAGGYDAWKEQNQ